MENPTINTQVRVSIPDYTGWAQDAAKAVDGQTGVITKTIDNYAFEGRPAYLVTFDTPVKSWHRDIDPDTPSFWFKANELTQKDSPQ